ncbi:hypothetical protein SAMD00019534_022030, partial [Acytostelium subglobosum LB1]|uniref:hypothetical protein n=1 Tax=Acytostelium subglobosum LB1 TaxID=1410327 RepID=UPI000645110E
MRFIISLIMVALLASCAFADFSGCGNAARKCIKIGESCDPTSNLNVCQAGSVCPTPPVKNPNCTALVGTGGYCDGNAFTCQPGLTCYDGDVPTCQWTKYATYGESCDSKVDCSSSNMICLDGKCVIQANKNCVNDDDCPYGAWCATNSTASPIYNFCQQTLALGGNCTDSANTQCGVGLICSANDNDRIQRSCIAVNSKGSGAPCSPGATSPSLDGAFPYIECDVSQGLVCLGSGPITNYTCQLPPAVTGVTIDCGNRSTGYCPVLQTCNCPTYDSSIGTCGPTYNLGSECSKSINDLVSCAQRNKCQFNSGRTSSKYSCMYRNCASIMCNNKCGQTSLADVNTCKTSEPLYGACRSASSFVRPSIVIAAIVAVVAMLF